MKNLERVAELLAELRTLAETDFERHRLDVLERDMHEPPQIEVIDERHQKFNGVVYGKAKSGHYFAGRSIHRDIWQYYFGEIPEGYHIHHSDENPGNNDIENLRIVTKEEHARLHGKLINNRTKEHFVCEICGREFDAISNGRNRYCSYECMRKGDYLQQQRWTKTCEWCGNIFSTRHPEQKFCCHKCHMTARYAKQKREKICPVCGKNFFPKSKHVVYCSPACAFKSRRKRIKKTCPICGKEFETRPCEDHKTCSVKCGRKLAAQTISSK